MIRQLRLVRAIGQFESLNPSPAIDLRRLTLIYAENGRGKTTLAAIMRSLSSGEPLHINERRRLGVAHNPEAIIDCSGATSPACFQKGAWSRTCPDVLVFDDFFVDRNVYSGMDVDAEHRQNLHDLILGATGVNLARRVDELAAKIRTHNTELRTKAGAIPTSERYGLSVDEFCGLPATPDVDDAIRASEQRLTALQNADAVRSTAEFTALALPPVDVAAVSALLGRTVADLDRQAAEAVKAHFEALGNGAEGWVGTGMRFGAGGADLTSEADCPFCKQSLRTSAIFNDYRAYFGQAYSRLQAELVAAEIRIEAALKGDSLAGFERQFRTAQERRRFWASYATMPEVGVDTTALATAWQQTRDSIVAAIRAKRADPLTAAALNAEAQSHVGAYEAAAAVVKAASDALAACNEAIKQIKESIEGGSTATAESELNRLRATKARHGPTVAALCSAYLNERTAKEAAEADKAAAQQALESHRAAVFPNWQSAINTYLARLGAGFTIVKIESQPTGGRPSCVYRLVINGHEVPVAANTAPAGSHTFKSTLSAGDRNTLALAFFLASLDQDVSRANRVVVLDDPMSSLDKHRRRATIEEIRRLLPTVAQVIVMSHDESFLFAVYDHVSPRNAQRSVTDTAALVLARGPNGSAIDEWDVESEKIGRHDKRHLHLMKFERGEGGDPMQVAQSIRPHLERYLRVACPDKFKEGEMLRDFRNRARAAQQSGRPIISQAKLTELDRLVEFSNGFHHDTDADAGRAAINDAELRHYVQRTLAFVSV